jgi:hypothetical protein
MSATNTVYYQGGAEWFGDRTGKTKAELKRQIKADPTQVYLTDTTAPVLGGPKWEGRASDLPEGVVFNVVGPDPFTKRDWYASVYRNKNGGLTVK